MGSKLTQGVEGTQYTKDAAFDFEVNESITFLKLKHQVYENTDVNPNRYDIELIIQIDTQMCVRVWGEG